MTQTLIISSCIQPMKDVPMLRVIDPFIRLNQFCCSFLMWVKEPAIQKIIICDNSGPKLNFDPLYEMTRAKGKKIEILPFVGNRYAVTMKGKGYGEGEIMKYIFERSQLISDTKSFYKVTGRIYINNFDLINKVHHQAIRVFDTKKSSYQRLVKRGALMLFPHSRHGIGRVETFFYKCDKKFFINNLIERSELVNDNKGFTLEHSYFYPLIRHGFSTFKIKPSIVGISGTTGRVYKDGQDFPEHIKRKGQKLAKDLIIN